MKSTRKIRRASRRLFRLCVVDGRLDGDRVRHVAQRIAASRRRGGLAILSDLQRLVRLDEGRRAAVVESATSLSADLRESVSAGLQRIYGAGLRLSFEENPGLIGGLRIKVGSDVYDGSVRGRLSELETRL